MAETPWKFDPYGVLGALDKHRVSYITIGGFARVVQGPIPRRILAAHLGPWRHAAPVGLQLMGSVVAAVAGNARATLTWNTVPEATSYKIYRSETGTFDGVAIGSTSGTTFKQYNLVNGTTYFYLVAGRNLGGEGPRSAVVPVTPASRNGRQL